MRIEEFDYHLPEELIAQHPVTPRDASRLLVLHREDGRTEHRRFRDLPGYLREGDLLVLNDTRVMPARLLGRKAGSGGQAELLLLQSAGMDRWQAMARPGRRLQPGAKVVFGDEELFAEILEALPGGGRLVHLLSGPNARGRTVHDLLHALGEIPLPPYITQGPPPAERGCYQTIFARDEGSSAAPTAGLHFTEDIFAQLESRGVQRTFVTLHVGMATFKPIQVEDIEEHEMHEEFFSISAETADLINSTRRRGGRIISVGTTSTRTLESAADEEGIVRPMVGSTRLYIMPGYYFRVVDAQVTNFHMPRSSLLLLISGFAGRENILRAYGEAVARRYRFLSFGDAMLIL
ncbi:MAG: tRNA preQ1(34) S-adenosylmethionine ribosyltransferase-isomerase QueA [Armatimonadota bacterium]